MLLLNYRNGLDTTDFFFHKQDYAINFQLK